MKRQLTGALKLFTIAVILLSAHCAVDKQTVTETIPLPEHPRPDFMRGEWLNLNGQWSFSLDSLNVGESEGWATGEIPFSREITVPFSWASTLSGIGIKGIHIGWYARDIAIPRDWKEKRVYVVIGASDCTTTAWLNGTLLGSHEGGYTPFEFDVTDALTGRAGNRLVIRVEDEPTSGRLVGKQVYGEAKGIWQTVYLEARSEAHIVNAHFTPDVDGERVTVRVTFSKPLPIGHTLTAVFDDPAVGVSSHPVELAKNEITVDIPIRNPHLWELDDPYLYDVDLVMEKDDREIDRIQTYFGMRKIGMSPLPGSDDMYITLNDRPVYIKMALDQSYHEDGYYTFPSDDFMREEIERAKNIGLNGLRIHIKSEMPRKLYWADKLGLLIMADIPNIGGEPDAYGRANWEYTAFRQIARDYNHPSIFSWVLFNETWGLMSRVEKAPGEFANEYTKDTQEWVRSMYSRAKRADTTRLVEDNSPYRSNHVVSDINSWHAYRPAYKWAEFMDMTVKNTYFESPWNYISDNLQDYVPMMNSECGNVWGYSGGTGDVDIAYEYHIMMNEFRRRPKICGFIFTEFHDVINEWNGYYRFDRSLKDFGLDELCPGMKIEDFHADMYLVPGDDFKQTVKPGERFSVPVAASFMTGNVPEKMTVKTLLHGWNTLGEHVEFAAGEFNIAPEEYAVLDLLPVKLKAPEDACLAIFCTMLIDDKGAIVHRNFVPIQVSDGDSPQYENSDAKTYILRTPPDKFTANEWSVSSKSILDGRKVWGTGTGYIEYEFPMPENFDIYHISDMEFIAELSARHVQGKDIEADFVSQSIDNVTARGIDPGHNPNSYPMTDDVKFPSSVAISLNGMGSHDVALDDDPSDHRGILSWLNQREDDTLHEAGSYGYLAKARFPNEISQKAANEGVLRVRLTVEASDSTSGGLAVYGERFGRFPVNPTIIIHMK